MMATNPLRGKYVSRSVFQRAVEKNKRLLNDIRILVGDDPFEARLMKKHYQARFGREADLNAQLKELLNLALEEGKKKQIVPFEDNSNKPINIKLLKHGPNERN